METYVEPQGEKHCYNCYSIIKLHILLYYIYNKQVSSEDSDQKKKKIMSGSRPWLVVTQSL